jgi:phage terminase small subunit
MTGIGRTGDDLSPQQHRFLEELMRHGHRQRAADAVGVSPSTVYRWLDNPVVQARYRELRSAALEHVLSEVQCGASNAVQVLVDIATNENAPTSSRVSAARALLDFALRGAEADLQARLEALESRLKERAASPVRSVL